MLHPHALRDGIVIPGCRVLQFSPARALPAENFDDELERLYGEHVARLPSSRGGIVESTREWIRSRLRDVFYRRGILGIEPEPGNRRHDFVSRLVETQAIAIGPLNRIDRFAEQPRESLESGKEKLENVKIDLSGALNVSYTTEEACAKAPFLFSIFRPGK